MTHEAAMASQAALHGTMVTVTRTTEVRDLDSLAVSATPESRAFQTLPPIPATRAVDGAGIVADYTLHVMPGPWPVAVGHLVSLEGEQFRVVRADELRRGGALVLTTVQLVRGVRAAA